MPSPRGVLGETPSPVCRSANRHRDPHHFCRGTYSSGFAFWAKEHTCSCSCHTVEERMPPKGPSGAYSEVDKRTRELAEWYAAGLAPKLAERLTAEHLADSNTQLPKLPDLHRPNRYPNPGLQPRPVTGFPEAGAFLASGGLISGRGRKVEIIRDGCTSTGRCDPPDIDPEAAKLVGWVDEAQHFEETGELFPADSAYEINPEVLQNVHKAWTTRAEEAFALTGKGDVIETCMLEDEVARSTFGEFLVSGRQVGKAAALDRWRREHLEEMAGTNQGMIATFVSKATHELAKRQLGEREVQVVRAMQAGRGLAVIRGEINVNAGLEGDEVISLRLEDTYLAMEKIPAGVIYDFPSIAAFNAWLDRADG